MNRFIMEITEQRICKKFNIKNNNRSKIIDLALIEYLILTAPKEN